MVLRSAGRGLVGSRLFRGIVNTQRSLQNYNKQANKRRRTSSSSSGGGNLGITNQIDVKRVYKKKKRKSKRIVKRWKKFQRRVQRAISNSVPTQIELMRGHIDVTAAANNQQMFACMLYGEFGVSGAANDLGSQDLYQIISNSTSLSTTATNKLQFRGAFLDMYITNTGLVPAGTTIYVDIYTIYCRRDVFQYNGASDFCANTYGDSGNLSGGTTALSSTAFGVTPFQNPQFCSHFKITDVKRTVLEPGQTYNLQMKDHKSRNYFYNKTNKVVCLKGWTKGFLCIFKGAAGYNQQDVASNVAVEALRTYTYDYIQDNPQRAGYINV